MSIIVDAQNKTGAALGEVGSNLEKVKSKTVEVGQHLDKMKEKSELMEGAMKKLGAAAAIAFGAITAAGALAVNAYVDAAAQMEVANQSVGNTIDQLSKKQLAALNKELGDGAKGFAGVANAMLKAGESAVKMGFDDETASNSFARLFATTKSVKQATEEVGIAMDLARYKGISLEDATSKLMLVHAGATKELKTLGLQVDDTASAMDNLAAIQKQVAGTAVTFAESTKGSIEVLKVQFDNLRESIGGALEPAVSQILEKLKPIVDGFIKWADANPRLIQTIFNVGLAITGLIAAVVTIGAWMSGLATTAATLGIGLAPLAAIIAGIVVGVALLSAGIVLLVQNWEKVIAWIEDNTGLISAFKDLWDTLSRVWQEQLLPALLRVWQALEPLMPILKAIGIVLGGMFVAALKLAIEILRVAIEVFGTLFDAASKIASWLIKTLTPAFRGVADAVIWVIEKIKELIEWFSKLNVVQGMGNVVKSIGGAIGNLFGRAEGGSVQPSRSFLVGEQGPEIFTPGEMGRISPLGAGVGGMNIIINLSGPFLGGEGVGELIGNDIVRTLKQNIKI